jgi:cytochrome c-type biogenesis protein CcmH
VLLFAIIAAILAGLALLIIVPSLVRPPKRTVVDRHEQNVAIARQRLAELHAARTNGSVSEDDYAASRAELEQSLALDLAQLDRTKSRHPADDDLRSGPSSVTLPILIAFAVPVVAGMLYLVVGEPGALSGTNPAQSSTATNDSQQPSVEIMIDQLKARLAENPDDVRGWSILARSSMQLQRYDEAAAAYERWNELEPGNATILVQYADALAMRSGGRLNGRPAELIDEALSIDPDQPQGLWLAGMAAERRGDFEQAMTHWTRLLPLVEQDPQSRSELMGLIEDLVQRASAQGVELQPPGTADSGTPPARGDQPTAAALTVRVSLAPELRDQAEPDDTVFVFARAVEGPPMPLAAARKRVSELPFEVTLDDSGAMIPNMKLSSFERVNVVARVSKSGQPTAGSGDLEGAVEDVSTASNASLDIVIARKLP